MLKYLTRLRLVQLWTAAVLVATAVSATFGTIPSVGTAMLLIALSLAPATIIMLLWPRVQPQPVDHVTRRSRK
jgi:hypothetical protein